MKVLVLAGTQDGRSIGEKLAQAGFDVVLSTLTEYGAEIVQAYGLSVRFGAFDKVSFSAFLRQEEIRAVVDATHPYARIIQELASSICTELALPYFRWDRPKTFIENYPLVYSVKDLEEAAEMASSFGERIFLTTGSNSLAEWLNIPCLKDKTLFVRVLPTANVLARCESLGLKPKQIIAAQGPFSKAFNMALFEQLGIDVVVTKDSGSTGGIQAKIEACQERSIPLVVLNRPKFGEKALEMEEFIKELEEQLWQMKLFS